MIKNRLCGCVVMNFIFSSAWVAPEIPTDNIPFMNCFKDSCRNFTRYSTIGIFTRSFKNSLTISHISITIQGFFYKILKIIFQQFLEQLRQVILEGSLREFPLGFFRISFRDFQTISFRKSFRNNYLLEISPRTHPEVPKSLNLFKKSSQELLERLLLEFFHVFLQKISQGLLQKFPWGIPNPNGCLNKQNQRNFKFAKYVNSDEINFFSTSFPNSRLSKIRTSL